MPDLVKAAAAAAAAGPYWPDGLAEPLRGKTDRETIDHLFKAVGELRQTAAEPPPEKPEGYKLELSPEVAKAFPDLERDPALAAWREVAHELKLAPKTFSQAFEKLYGRMVEKGLIEPPIEIEKEVAALMSGKGDPIEQKAEAARRINAAAAGIQGLVTRGHLDQTEGNVLTALMDRAAGVKLVEKLIRLRAEHGVQTGGTAASGSPQQSLEQDLADPRYDFNSPKFDPEFRRQVDQRWQQAYANGRR